LWPYAIEDKFLTINLLGEREMRTLKRFFKDERGLEGSEYALLLALLCLAIVVAIGLLRDAIANAFTRGSTVIDAATAQAGNP
jgi:Flp pilus assembly pilin Flp